MKCRAGIQLIAVMSLGMAASLLASRDIAIASPPTASVPDYDAAAEYRSGIEALQAQRYQAAKEAFDHVLSVAPRDANTNFLAGLAAAGLNDLVGARKYYERAVTADKDLVAAQRELGVAYASLGERKKALAQLAVLRAIGERCGGACARVAEIDRAIRALAAAIGTQP